MKQLWYSNQEHIGLNTGTELLQCDFLDWRTFLSYNI